MDPSNVQDGITRTGLLKHLINMFHLQERRFQIMAVLSRKMAKDKITSHSFLWHQDNIWGLGRSGEILEEKHNKQWRWNIYPQQIQILILVPVMGVYLCHAMKIRKMGMPCILLTDFKLHNGILSTI